MSQTQRTVLIALGVGIVLWYCFLRSKPSKPSKTIKEIRRRLGIIDPKFAAIPIVENRSETFTEEQSLIHLCLKNPQTGKEYDIDTLMQVALHEVAHVLTEEDAPEHGTEFTSNFASLLKRADRAGVYNIATPEPVGYCGMR